MSRVDLSGANLIPRFVIQIFQMVYSKLGELLVRTAGVFPQTKKGLHDTSNPYKSAAMSLLFSKNSELYTRHRLSKF